MSLHGDFTLANCTYRALTDELVILDWSAADWLGLKGDVGPAAIDVAIFLQSTLYRRPFEPRLRNSRGLVAAFMAGYVAGRGRVPPDLGPIGSTVLGLYARHSYKDIGPRALLRAPSFAYCQLVLWRLQLFGTPAAA